MAVRRKSNDERLAKQRDYQREYRKRMKANKVPDRNVIAQAFFHHVVASALGRERTERRLLRVLDEVELLLIDMGYDRHGTHAAISELLDRYEAGWAFQRKAHLLPKPDAANSDEFADDSD